MIDKCVATAIASGGITRLDTTIRDETDIVDLKRWLMQFGRAISMAYYPKQTGGIRATLMIVGLQPDQRALIAGTLESDHHRFRILTGDTS